MSSRVSASVPVSRGATVEGRIDFYPWVKKIASLAGAWRCRRQYRADLRRLLAAAPHMIDDIGLTPAQARWESAKPFWRR